MAHIVLKNGRELYTNDNFKDWEDLNERPQFIKLKCTEIYRSKGLGDNIESDVELIINKDFIYEINN